MKIIGNRDRHFDQVLLNTSQKVFDYYKTLSNDQSLRIDYNYEKFKQTFNEEMEKMENR